MTRAAGSGQQAEEMQCSADGGQRSTMCGGNGRRARGGESSTLVGQKGESEGEGEGDCASLLLATTLHFLLA